MISIIGATVLSLTQPWSGRNKSDLILTKDIKKLTLFRLLGNGPEMAVEVASEIEWSLFVCDSFLLTGV